MKQMNGMSILFIISHEGAPKSMPLSLVPRLRSIDLRLGTDYDVSVSVPLYLHRWGDSSVV